MRAASGVHAPGSAQACVIAYGFGLSLGSRSPQAWMPGEKPGASRFGSGATQLCLLRRLQAPSPGAST
jgi:hypothetical protein